MIWGITILGNLPCVCVCVCVCINIYIYIPAPNRCLRLPLASKWNWKVEKLGEPKDTQNLRRGLVDWDCFESPLSEANNWKTAEFLLKNGPIRVRPRILMVECFRKRREYQQCNLRNQRCHGLTSHLRTEDRLSKNGGFSLGYPKIPLVSPRPITWILGCSKCKIYGTWVFHHPILAANKFPLCQIHKDVVRIREQIGMYICISYCISSWYTPTPKSWDVPW